MNRREFTRLAATGALGAWPFGELGLNSVSAALPISPLMGRGVFMAHGKPVFLIAGSIDYFRCPPELWRDRMLKAKRGGINCIATCIAWNFHESEEGRFNFSGAHDLGRFIDICGELGLYFYARFGPFICDEWEGGGHPAWLIGKDAQFRAMHEPTLKHLRRWFDRLMPILVRRQITRGGPVILVQQENEYYFANRPDGRDYQATLVRWMREAGIEVTITDCNGYDTRVPGSHQTLNGFDTGKRYRPDRPDLPVMVSEHYTNYLDSYPDGTGLTRWRFKPWETPRKEGTPVAGAPVWWECELPRPKITGPLFLHPVGLSKGQAYLNGHAAGRYWEIGPQKTIYLPEPWWQDHNHLAIFDEEGRPPEQVYLKRDFRAPTAKFLV